MKRDRFQFNRAHVETAAAPAWVVTYADLVTLLLCVFVAILSMSTIKQDRFQTALASLHETFGTKAALESAGAPDQSLYGRLRSVIGQQASLDPAPSDVGPTISGASIVRTPQGAKLVLAGPLVFERGRTDLAEDARQTVIQVAGELKGRTCTIIVRGHGAGETPESEQSLRDLSYARAASAARILEQGGVSAQTISVVALGDGQPLLAHAYTEKRRAMNRRVEIEIIEGVESNVAIRLTPYEKG
jgi:chemotaxis protein MotB